MSDPVITERLARARQRSVMICTPIARNPVWEYTASLASTLLFLQEQGVRCTFQFVVGSSIVHKARNELVAHFLGSDFTDLLFIDDDMQWAPNDVLRLLGSDKALIGGVGRMRCQKPNSDPSVWCWRPLRDPDTGDLTQDPMGAVEVRGFGAAFMLINRRVFADMVEAHGDWKRDGAGGGTEDVLPDIGEAVGHGLLRDPEVELATAAPGRYDRALGLPRLGGVARRKWLTEIGDHALVMKLLGHGFGDQTLVADAVGRLRLGERNVPHAHEGSLGISSSSTEPEKLKEPTWPRRMVGSAHTWPPSWRQRWQKP